MLIQREAELHFFTVRFCNTPGAHNLKRPSHGLGSDLHDVLVL